MRPLPEHRISWTLADCTGCGYGTGKRAQEARDPGRRLQPRAPAALDVRFWQAMSQGGKSKPQRLAVRHITCGGSCFQSQTVSRRRLHQSHRRQRFSRIE